VLIKDDNEGVRETSQNSGISALKGPQPRRRIVRREIVSAVHAELIARRDASVALAAAGGDLAGALRAKVEIRLRPRAARRAPRDNWLSQQEVEHGTNSSRHDEADRDPEAQAHRPPRRIPAHIADHQDVERGQGAPGEGKVDAQAERRRRVVALGGKDDPPKVLHGDEREHRNRHGPTRDQPHLVGERRAGIRISEGDGVFHR